MFESIKVVKSNSRLPISSRGGDRKEGDWYELEDGNNSGKSYHADEPCPPATISSCLQIGMYESLNFAKRFHETPNV